LAYPAAFNEAYAAASSDSSIATASVSSGTQTGSLTFAVDQLAVGSTQISAGTVASPNDIVTSGTVLIGSGGAALGITSLDAGSGLAAGNHRILSQETIRPAQARRAGGCVALTFSFPYRGEDVRCRCTTANPAPGTKVPGWDLRRSTQSGLFPR